MSFGGCLCVLQCIIDYIDFTLVFVFFLWGIKWGCDGAWNASGSKSMFVGMDRCFFLWGWLVCSRPNLCKNIFYINLLNSKY